MRRRNCGGTPLLLRSKWRICPTTSYCKYHRGLRAWSAHKHQRVLSRKSKKGGLNHCLSVRWSTIYKASGVPKTAQRTEGFGTCRDLGTLSAKLRFDEGSHNGFLEELGKATRVLWALSLKPKQSKTTIRYTCLQH